MIVGTDKLKTGAVLWTMSPQMIRGALRNSGFILTGRHTFIGYNGCFIFGFCAYLLLIPGTYATTKMALS